MKYFSMIWAVSALFSFLACNLATHQKIKELRASSSELAQQTEKKLEHLVQLRNSINIQGRALTNEEITFSGSVTAFESSYQDWRSEFDKTADLPENKQRLALERSLHDSIHALHKSSEELSLQQN